jgi:hypothetical protein
VSRLLSLLFGDGAKELVMAFFEDLTPYTYLHPEEERDRTVNVGWLHRQHHFPTGETGAAFQAKLLKLCQRRVKRTRGFHPCDFCKGRNKPHGSAEIRVLGEGRVFAAPELVYHYVVAHGYKPPDEFIAAVLAWPDNRPEPDMETDQPRA